MNRSRGFTIVAWVRDGVRTERVPSVVVSSALPRSVISTRLAGRVARTVGDSWLLHVEPERR